MNQFLVQTSRCAVCGRVKEETNHWRLLYIGTTITDDGTREVLSIAQWDRDLAAHQNLYPACGNHCTHKLVDRFLTYNTLEPPSGAAGNPV